MTTHSTEELLQKALFQAAKVGNISLMREFISVGANPLGLDKEGHNAIFYANLQDPENTVALLLELQKKEKSNLEKSVLDCQNLTL